MSIGGDTSEKVAMEWKKSLALFALWALDVALARYEPQNGANKLS